MSEWKQYRRTNIAEMRPYMPGEDLNEVSVSGVDDPPNDHGMIARNPENHKDQWYVARAYFEANFAPQDAAQPEPTDDERAEALNVIFDGPPGPTAGRFVEVETDDGRSVRAGEWIKRDDGLWSLRIRRYIERQPVRGEAGEESGDDHE